MPALDFWREMQMQKQLHLRTAIPFTITQELRWVETSDNP
jgi:hypothetical protein